MKFLLCNAVFISSQQQGDVHSGRVTYIRDGPEKLMILPGSRHVLEVLHADHNHVRVLKRDTKAVTGTVVVYTMARPPALMERVDSFPHISSSPS